MSIFTDISNIKLHSEAVGRTSHAARVNDSIGRVETVGYMRLKADLFK